MAIDPISLARTAAAVTAATKTEPTAKASGGSATGIASTGGASGFADTVARLVTGVEQQGAQANAAVSGMLNKSVDVHDAMIALQKSELALQLTVQIRNKFVQAYQEIMRMPV